MIVLFVPPDNHNKNNQLWSTCIRTFISLILLLDCEYQFFAANGSKLLLLAYSSKNLRRLSEVAHDPFAVLDLTSTQNLDLFNPISGKRSIKAWARLSRWYPSTSLPSYLLRKINDDIFIGAFLFLIPCKQEWNPQKQDTNYQQSTDQSCSFWHILQKTVVCESRSVMALKGMRKNEIKEKILITIY